MFTDAFPGNLGVGGVNASADPQATPATATLMIEGVDDGPVLTNDTGFTGTENVPVFMDVLANDSGNDLRIVSAEAASGATVSFTGNIGDGITLDPSGGNVVGLSFGQTVSYDGLTQGDTIADIITFVVEDGAGNQAGDAAVTRKTLDLTTVGTVTTPSLDLDGVTVTGSTNVQSLNFNGLGIQGGPFTARLDVGETMSLDFDHLAANVIFQIGTLNNTTGVDGGQVLVEGFDADGLSLGTQVLGINFGTFDGNISAAFGNVPLSQVDITGQGDAFIMRTLNFDEIQGDGFAIIEIAGVNDAPVITDQLFTVAESGFGVFDTLGVDDPDRNEDVFSLTFDVVSGPANGSASLDFGDFFFTLDGAFEDVSAGTFRDVEIVYTATDGLGAVSDPGTITVRVTGENDPVTGVDDTATVDQDSTVLIDAAANDTDIDSADVLTVTAVGAASNGTVVVEAGQARYTPDAGFSGTDSFTYTVSDGNGSTDTATVSVTVNKVGPELTNDFGFTGTENVPVFMDVLANDTGNDLRIVSAQAASGASVTFSGAIDDGLTLDPSGGNAGTLGFGQTISLDSLAPGDSITDIVTFVVEDGAGNQAGDAVVTRQALDFRGQTISNVPSLNQNGVTLSGSGNLNAPNFNDLGIAGGAFSNRLDAGEVLNLDFDHLAANVALFVGGTFNNTGINGGQISVVGFDADGLSIGTQVINLGFGPSFGARISEVLGNVPLSRVEITGQGDSIGIESISFDEIQGDGFAIIEISGVNDAPVIVDQTLAVNEDSFGVFEQLTVDDPDLNHEQFDLTYNIVSAPAEGTTNIFDFGGPELEFTLDGGFQDVALGEVRDVVITYTATDPDGAVSAPGTITIQITGNNDVPVVVGETATLDEDTTINIDVLANDSDIDSGDVLTVSAASAGSGQVVIEADNSLTYTPDPDFTGSDTINYTVSDGNGGVVGGTVAVTVNPDDIILFTANADTVDFDTVNGNDVADGNLTDALAGDDFAELPSNPAERLEAGFLSAGILFNAGAGNDTVIGGDDTDITFIFGGSGDDSLVAGNTNHDIFAGDGDDTIVGGDATELTGGNAGNDLMFGGGSFDDMEGNDGNDTIFGGDGNDVINGGSGADVLEGDAGNDAIGGEEGDDSLSGGDGDDILSGGAGADTLDGGAGRDFLSYVSSDDAVSVNLGTGAASGGDAQGDVISNFQDLSGSSNALQSDTLIGNADDNRIFGQEGGDNLQGGDGNDTLFGGAGADAHFGGDGFDFADFSGSGEAVDVDVAFQALGGDTQGDTFFSVEGFIGSDFDDRFIGNTVSESFQGGDGDDTIAGLQGDDTILGEDGNDQISGGGGNDQIFGGEGTGDLTGGDGNDLIIGGSGFDFIVGGNGDDTIEGGAGGDDMTGGAGSDVLSYAGSAAGVNVSLAAGSASGGDAAGDLFFGFENLTGSGSADTLTGDGNANVLDGGAGNDSLDGGAGDDRFDFRTGDGNDTVDGFVAGARTEDVIDFSIDAAITGTGDLSIGDDGSGNALIEYGSGDSITLLGVDHNNLDADDFQF